VSPAAVGTSPDPAARIFELRCADVLDVRCDTSWRSADRNELVSRAQQHGGTAHGFTPAWYSLERLGQVAAAVTDCDGRDCTRSAAATQRSGYVAQPQAVDFASRAKGEAQAITERRGAGAVLRG
jgi:hypothetical protein